jgi:glycosyltransferase involved in cell wall biosynthesis
MYETVDFPQVFVNHLRSIGVNEIWTPSSFCRDSMVRAGLGSVGGGIHIMPLGVDSRMFSREHADEPRYIPGNLGGPLAGKFKFLTTMGYSERKGVSILIRAFVEEFGLGNGGLDAGKVALYFKGGWYDAVKARSEIESMIFSIPGFGISGISAEKIPYIAYDFNIYSDEILASLYKACDAFVLPSRGEGFSLPMAEAMSMGMPTIGTRWSGNLEFMNDENSYLIGIEGFAEEPRCNWVTNYYIGQKFAVPSLGHLKQMMRHVYENQEEAKRKGRIAREHMVNNFDWSVSCSRMKKRLIEIANGE